MIVKIIETTAADGRIVRAGSVENLSERDAELLIGLGKASKELDPPPVEEPVAPKRAKAKHGR